MSKKHWLSLSYILLCIALVVTATQCAPQAAPTVDTSAVETAEAKAAAAGAEAAAAEAAVTAEAEKVEAAKAAAATAEAKAEEAAGASKDEVAAAQATVEAAKAEAETAKAEADTAKTEADAAKAKAEAAKAEADAAKAEADAAKAEAEAAKAEAEKPSIVSPPGSLPIVEDKVTLSVMILQRPGVEDYATNEYTKWLEEQTNVHLEFEVVPAADAQEKLNVTLASGDYPDVILGLSIDASLQAQMGMEGVFLPLNDLIEQHGYWSKRIFDEEKPHIKKLITSPDGNIYALPEINECFHCFNAQKMWIYKPWLDKLGLDVPTTTEEFYQVLKAFKEQDPNGNGEADEIPLSGSVDGWHGQIGRFLMNAFVYYDYIQHPRLLLKDGKVESALTQPGYKEGLKYLHRLYAEGLIDPASLTQDYTQLQGLGNHEPPILGTSPAGWQGNFIQVLSVEEGGRLEDWVTVPALAGPDGFRTAAYAPWGFYTGGFVITEACEHPEVAFRVGDFLYSVDATIRNVFGVEGEDWVWAESGEKGIDGGPALFRALTEWTEEIQNHSWNQAGITYRSSEFRMGQVAEGQLLEVILYEGTAQNYAPYAPPIEDLIPPLVFTKEQAQELADIEVAVDNYGDEMFGRFVTGDADIEAEWETYLQTLDGSGLPRLLEIYQEAYDGLAL